MNSQRVLQHHMPDGILHLYRLIGKISLKTIQFRNFCPLKLVRKRRELMKIAKPFSLNVILNSFTQFTVPEKSAIQSRIILYFLETENCIMCHNFHQLLYDSPWLSMIPHHIINR